VCMCSYALSTGVSGRDLTELDEVLHRDGRCVTGPGERSHAMRTPLLSGDDALLRLRWSVTKTRAPFLGCAVTRPIAVLLMASTPLNDFLAVVTGGSLRPLFLCIGSTAIQAQWSRVGVRHRRRGFYTTGERTVALRTLECASNCLVRPTGRTYPGARRRIDRGWHPTRVILTDVRALGTAHPCRRVPRTTPIVIFAIKKAGFRQFCSPWSDVNLIGAPPPRTGVPRATPPWQRLSFTRTKPTIATILRERRREVIANGLVAFFAKAEGALLFPTISSFVPYLITVGDMILPHFRLGAYNGDQLIGVQTLARRDQGALHLDAAARNTGLSGRVASNLSIGSKAARNGTVLRVEVSGALDRIQTTTWRMLAQPWAQGTLRARRAVDLVAPRRGKRSLAPLALTHPYQGHFPSGHCIKINFTSV